MTHAHRLSLAAGKATGAPGTAVCTMHEPKLPMALGGSVDPQIGQRHV